MRKQEGQLPKTLPKHDPATGEIYEDEIVKATLDAEGREIPDPTPVAPPVGYVKRESIADMIRRMVRDQTLASQLEAQGVETFEEADDFDVGDDVEPNSPYEERELEGFVELKDGRRAAKRAQEEEISRAATERPKPSSEPQATPPKPSTEVPPSPGDDKSGE